MFGNFKYKLAHLVVKGKLLKENEWFWTLRNPIVNPDVKVQKI
jgi:hypothetical protein